MRKAGRDRREIPLALESLRMWERMNDTVGTDTGCRRAGILFAAKSDVEVAGRERWLDHARPYQINARMISGGELDRLAPGSGRAWKGALYCPTDGGAEPQRAAPAIARAARRAGARILTGWAVRGLDVVAHGAARRRSGAALWYEGAAYRKRLDGGYPVADGSVSVASLVPDSVRLAGAFLAALWNERRHLRIRVGQDFAREWRERRPVPLDQVSPHERTRVLDPKPDRRYSHAALAHLARLFPVFAQARVIGDWAGMIDGPPDAVPVVSAVDGVPGLVVATGFSGHGFGVGPAAGRLAADLATGVPPVVDPYDVRLSRFSDGSRPRPMSGV